MITSAESIQSISLFVEDRRAEGSRAVESGDRQQACEIYRETIDHLLENRNTYVNFHRGMGSVVGGALGLLLAFLIPGGHTLTALGAAFGYGLLGERVGKYTGDKFSSDDYLAALIDLHHQLVKNSPPEDPPLTYWKNLVVLETPFSIFAPLLQGEGFGTSWAALKGLIGFDPFAIAMEHAREDFPSWPTMLAMARALPPLQVLPDEAEPLAHALYSRIRTDSGVNQLLGRLYHLYRGKGVDLHVYQHRQRFQEDIRVLFERDFEQNPESESAVVNLASLLSRRNVLDESSGQVYLAQFRLDPNNSQAAANAVRSLPDLGNHLDLVEGVLEREASISLPESDRVRVVEARARDLASRSDSSPEALGIYARLLAAQHVPDVAFCLADAQLRSVDLASLTRPVAETAFERRDRLDDKQRMYLARYFESEASMNPEDAPSHLMAARMMTEAGDWKKSAELLEGFQGRARDPSHRMETLTSLARTYRAGGQMARAFEYFKGVCLVKPSPELMEEVFELHRELRQGQQRPALAREILLLIKTVEPGFVSLEGETIDDLLEDYSSVFDHYQQESLLKVGGGGMAEVFRGVHKQSGEIHMIKKLRTDFGTAEEMSRFATLFSSEIRAIKKINRADHTGSSHVITLFHESAEESHYCYSMEALDEVLQERLSRTGPMHESEVAELLRQIGMGIGAAHAAGVIHRDLNPRNVGFGNGILKIFDFGTAHILRTTLHITLSSRASDYILGTPCYMSPEQSVGEPFDETTDIFSLGCIGYELLTGDLAFPGQVGSLLLNHVPGLLDRIEERLATVAGSRMTRAIVKAMQVKKEDRHRSADQFLRALKGV